MRLAVGLFVWACCAAVIGCQRKTSSSRDRTSKDPVYDLALKKGYALAQSVQSTWQRWLAQTVLEHEVEHKITPTSISEADLEASFAKNRRRFEKPERRSSTHLIAVVNAGQSVNGTSSVDEQAKAFIESAIEYVKGKSHPAAELQNFLDATPKNLLSFNAMVQDVPPLDKEAKAEPTYLEALFSAPNLGLIPKAIRTGYGWHAIVLTQIQPAFQTPKTQAIHALRDELTAQRRKMAVGALIGRSKQYHRVKRFPENLNALSKTYHDDAHMLMTE